jgi:GTP cyclohydrolase I
MNVRRAEAARAIDTFLRALGRDPATEPDLRDTGARVADAYIDELCAGYGVDIEALVHRNVIAHSGATTQVIALRDIPVATTCPHHLMPATGIATVAFSPNAKILGLGAIAELVNAYSKRLTLQEALGENVAGALFAHLAPAWAGCRLVLAHACVSVRGVRAHGARAETVALAGPLDEPTRAAALAVLGARA